MIIFHHNDADGRMSAAIVMLRHGQCRCVALDYKDPVPVDQIIPGDQLWIVDFSLKPEVMAEVLKRTRDVIWIDHHATAAAYDYGRTLPGLRNFENKVAAACELTWAYVYPDVDAPLAVKLLGDYDKFALKYEPETIRFYEGLKLELGVMDPTSRLWEELLQAFYKRVPPIVEAGHTAIRYRDSYCAEIRESFGYETTFEGLKCYVLNVYRFGSGAYGDKMNIHDACIAYVHDGKKFTVSMYSNKPNVDVSVVCKKYGGGGHKSASGFVCETLPWSRG